MIDWSSETEIIFPDGKVDAELIPAICVKIEVIFCIIKLLE